MSLTVLVGGRRVRLDDGDLLGVGGEGRVYRAGSRAIKVLTSVSAERKKKLAAFPSAMPKTVVGPLELCTDAAGDVVGYAMHVVERAVDAHRLSQRRWREARMCASDVVSIFADLDATVSKLHARGIVVGDLNDGNVLLTKSGRDWSPWLIDADSMQYGGFACPVAHERFLDPRLYGQDLATGVLSRETDWYAFAVLFFASMVFVHPYGGAHASYPTLLRRAEARHSVLRSDVKLPRAALRPEILPDEALAWFHGVFERDERTPPPRSLLRARFERCACGVEHARKVCPMCTASATVVAETRAVGTIRATTMWKARPGESVVAADAAGALAYVVRDREGLRRESGQRVVAEDASANAVVRIAGAATWVIGGRARRVEREQVVEDAAVGCVHGGPAADAGTAGLVHVEGGWLVRSDGTRIGQALDGQTFVRVGATLGIAFYRAGALTLFFVFDTRRGPLRQLDLPHLDGKLVEWDATFDHEHVLLSTLTERDGRLTCTAHLVTAAGELVASERGAPGSSAILANVGGKCLARGAVLAATDDGLVLVRADRRTRTFVSARAFAETRALVPPDADLLVGPGGSVYVVTHDEIVHLCFEGTSKP